jgi:hypothetical protein
MKKEMRTRKNEEEEERHSKIGDNWRGGLRKNLGWRGEGDLYWVVGLPHTNVAHICTTTYPHPVEMCYPHICTVWAGGGPNASL